MKHRRLALLLLLNAAVVGLILVLIQNRSQLWQIGGTGTQVNWGERLADDADDDPTCADCNVLMISLDIFRPDHMPCMGYPTDTTPNICEMAKHGTLFEDFIVHAYQTPVSQMSLFTGRYPSSSGYVSFGSVLPDGMPYLPEQLKAAGYNTVAMGSSFEVMTDMTSSQDGNPRFHKEGLNPGLSFGRGFDRFIFTGNRNLPTDAIPWIEEHEDEKFFLWLILGTLHWPYGDHGDPAERTKFDPPGYDGIFAKGDRLGFTTISRIFDGNFYPRSSRRPIPVTSADEAYINGRYDFGLWTVDQFIGELLAAIPEDVLANTLILLHGVHGEDLGEHGYFGHYDIYDTEVDSTLLVINPHHKAEAVRVAEQVEGVDLAPTLLDVLDLPPMADTDGSSFKRALATGVGDPDRVTFFQRMPLWEDIFRHRTKMPQRYVEKIMPILDEKIYGDTGLRTSRWKLIHRQARKIEAKVSWYEHLTKRLVIRPEWELYDLEADPMEMTNVASSHPEVAAELQAKLLAWEHRVGADEPHDRGAEL